MSDQSWSGRTNWAQVGIATATQNFATGLTFGSFGTLVLAIESEFHASRSSSSLAISLLVVSLSITSSVLGRLLERVSIRTVMMAGAVLGSVAFGLASVAREAWQLLVIYLVLLGPATAMLGVLPSMTLASRWAAEPQRGLAMGIVNMPVLVMIVPLTIAVVLESSGIRQVYRLLALADLAVLLLVLFVRDRPVVAEADGAVAVAGGGPVDNRHAILRSPVFWLMVVALGLVVGAGTMKLAHFVPLLIQQGRSFHEANSLLAISGGAGLFGSFIFGALADRIGGFRALVCNALVQAGMWTIFLAPVSYGILVVDAVIVGACGAGVQAAFGVALGVVFGQASFSRAFGLSSLFTLPFLFGLTPLASLLYEATGNYHLPMGMMIGGFIIAAAIFVYLGTAERRARAIHEEGRIP
ncbi:MAG: MFS transporter [Novosphingobium sp.]